MRATSRWIAPASLVVAFSLLTATATRAGEEPFSEADYDRHARQVVKRDAFPVLFDPPLVEAGKVGRRLGDDDLVIGIELGGEARAYPVQVMGVHELVNDEAGGVPIAVSW